MYVWFTVLSFAFALVGLGCWAVWFLNPPPAEKHAGYSMAVLGLCFGCGLLCHLWLVEVTGSLRWAAVLTFGVGLVQSLCARRQLASHVLPLFPTALWRGMGLVTAVLALPILLQPIAEWDARYVWFFNAKLIYFNEGLNAQGPWADSAIQWSHPGYPKLLAATAAQVAYLCGIWNRYLPKVSLLYFLMPLLGCSALLFTQRRMAGFFFLFAAVILRCSHTFGSGYMDGWAAAYLGMGTVLILLALSDRDSEFRSLSWMSGVLFWALAGNLKSESQLFFGSMALAALAGMFLSATVRQQLRQVPRAFWIAAAVLALPLITWLLLRRLWGVEIWFTMDAPAFERLGHRVGNRFDLIFVLKAVWWRVEIVGLFALVALCSVLYPVQRAWLAVAGTGCAIYLAGLSVVYLMTPHDVHWHVYTSVGRVLLPAVTTLPAAAATVLYSDSRRTAAMRS